METTRPYWPRWSQALQRLGLSELVVWLLEAAGPLTVLGAQALHVGRPFLGGEQVAALASLLEQDDERRLFTAFLREPAAWTG